MQLLRNFMSSQLCSVTARLAPFAMYILCLVFEQPLSHALMAAGGDVRWLYAFKVGLVALLLLGFRNAYDELSRPGQLSAWEYGFCIALGLIVFALWILPYPSWAVLGEAGAGFDPTRNGEIDWHLAGTRIAGAALIVPVMEELFWRSFVMRWLVHTNFLQVDPARTTRYAFLATACLFAVEHNLWLAGLLAGIAYGWLYAKLRNLWAPVLAHAVTNGALGLWVVQTSAWRYW